MEIKVKQHIVVSTVGAMPDKRWETGLAVQFVAHKQATVLLLCRQAQAHFIHSVHMRINRSTLTTKPHHVPGGPGLCMWGPGVG